MEPAVEVELGRDEGADLEVLVRDVHALSSRGDDALGEKFADERKGDLGKDVWIDKSTWGRKLGVSEESDEQARRRAR